MAKTRFTAEKRFSAEEAAGMAQALLESGLHPRTVQARLREYGVRWSFHYGRHQGARQRRRYLRQLGLTPCPGCGQGVRGEGLCVACLERKWAEHPKNLPSSGIMTP